MTLAAITMTAPEAASPVQMYRATYSPDDGGALQPLRKVKQYLLS